ncbi:uncharacterized protein LOC126657380 [Mercurialis annua]|uniref:uncharacterized protein LOC126657380 n=1 Tax=Mercurialis annua TaxID=3986 RepID=UPI0024ACDE5B|nr:uncharacterized protein LOC126657380 [Mercurialis annua]
MTRLTKKQREKINVASELGDDDWEGHDSLLDDQEKTTAIKLSTEGKPRNGRMGSHVSSRKVVVVTDSDGDESFQTAPQLLEDHLIQLSEYKGKPRGDHALSVIAEALNKEVKVEFAEKNYATLLYICLFCVTNRKGCAKELLLASKAIGLLGMIVEDEDCAHEIYQDFITVFLEDLVSESKKSKILDSLAIVTFFGAKNVEETEKAMQIIWKFLQADCNSGDKLIGQKSVLAAAISAWSFLLSSMEGWKINQNYWKGAIAYLSNLLEDDDDECVYVAAAEALALIFETDSIDKFSSEDSFKQGFKESITEKLRCQAMKATENVGKQEAIKDVLKHFEAGGKSSEAYAEFGGDELVLLTWTQRIQLKFVKSFLGEDGFVRHMKENEMLQSVFEFTPIDDYSRDKVCSPERTEMTLRFFEKIDCSMLSFMSKEKKQLLKRMTLSSNSCLNKARTRLLNKQRMLQLGNDYEE